MSSIISPNTRIRCEYQIGNYSIIDDYCYISVPIFIGDFFHIAPHVTIAGGKSNKFVADEFGGLSSGVKLFCGSDDFVNDIGNVLPPFCDGIKTHIIRGDVIFGKGVTIGANSVVMPNNRIPDGVCVGALSFVPPRFKFEPWSVYAGFPKLRLIKKRNKENVLREMKEIRKRTNEKNLSS